MYYDKAIVLSSGGVDSTTCLGMAIKDVGKENVMSVSFYYGQKHSKELDSAEAVAQYYGIVHRVIDISNIGIFDNSKCTLLQGRKNIDKGTYAEQTSRNANGMVSTYVPFRNGLMLSLMAALAMSEFPESNVCIYLGAHGDDAAGNAYADCSVAFSQAMYEAISEGTYGKVSVLTPLINMNKTQVVAEGLKLKVPYQLTWSCYEGGDRPCGNCGTCIDRAKAFALNNTVDPALNAKVVGKNQL